MKNIALIGMMGSGKTTLGKMLSERMHLDYYCADDFLERKYNRNISDIFEKDGESGFRIIESEVISELSKKRNVIIATGGGAILRKENIDVLRENGFILIFLNRDIDIIITDITTDNRPLIKEDKEKLKQIFRDREFLYKNYSDIIINNHECINETLDKLYNVLAFVSNVEYDEVNRRRIVYY